MRQVCFCTVLSFPDMVVRSSHHHCACNVSLSGHIQKPLASRVVLQGGFVQGWNYPAPVAVLALQTLERPGTALGVGKWTLPTGFHLILAAMLSLHIPCVIALVAVAKSVLQLFLALPGSCAQLLMQGWPLFSYILMYIYFYKARSG